MRCNLLEPPAAFRVARVVRVPGTLAFHKPRIPPLAVDWRRVWVFTVQTLAASVAVAWCGFCAFYAAWSFITANRSELVRLIQGAL